MFARSDIELASPNRLVPLYLIASYAYYHRNASVMPDDAYDLCCSRLAAEWFFVDHPHAHIIDKEGLSATTAFKLREADYPLIVKVAATSIINDREQEPMSNEITLVQIQGGINLPLTADYIETVLGVAPARTDKRAKFWTKDQYPTICERVAIKAKEAASVNLDTIASKRPTKPKASDGATGEQQTGAAQSGGDFFSTGNTAQPAAGGDFFSTGSTAQPADPSSFFG